MTAKDLVHTQLGFSQYLLDRFTQDFSESDAYFQPCPGGNHLVWILLHLAQTEDWIRERVTGEPYALPAEIHETYRGSPENCPPTGPTLEEARRIFRETRQRTMAMLEQTPDSRFDEASPPGTPPQFGTIGQLMALLGFHPLWHFGQLTVNRRMLNKPRLM